MEEVATPEKTLPAGTLLYLLLQAGPHNNSTISYLNEPCSTKEVYEWVNELVEEKNKQHGCSFVITNLSITRP